MASYAKLRSGGWGLRGAGMEPGATVTVETKAGKRKEEVVGKILWTAADGTQIATISGGAGETDGGGNRYTGRSCTVCGCKEAIDKRGYPVGGVRILRSGECGDCYEERKMGY